MARLNLLRSISTATLTHVTVISVRYPGVWNSGWHVTHTQQIFDEGMNCNDFFNVELSVY